MKRVNFFNTEPEYTDYENGSNYVLPNISYVKEINSIMFNSIVEPTNPNLVCVYDVTDTSRNTSLLYGYAIKYITRMIVDGVEMDVETYYQFDTEGLHTVEYILDDNTALPDTFFQNTKTLISIEIPNTVSTIEGNFISYGLTNLQEIIFHSQICPTITDSSYFEQNASRPSVIKYPNGADYSELITKLPEGWTIVEF